MPELFVPFAVDNEGRLCSPETAEKGRSYFCPACHETVILKHGKIRRVHFAHKIDGSCNQETIIHKTAKQLVQKAVHEWKTGKSDSPTLQREFDILPGVLACSRAAVRRGLPRTGSLFARLSQANLQGANLTGGNLYVANLVRGELQGADFTQAFLGGSNLFESNLQGANLNQARLPFANVSFAQLQGANLTGTDLRAANLFHANLTGAQQTHLDLTGANLQQTLGLHE